VNDGENEIVCGDCLEVMRRWPDGCVHCCVTSPPYWNLRDYNVEGQIGLEQTPEEYVAKMVEVFREVRRVLRDDGVLFLNLGDSYNSSPPGNKNPMSKSGLNGAQTSASYRARLEETQQRQQQHRGLVANLKPKDLVGIPWRVAFALRADGWYLRSGVPWVKRSAMPESVTDRPASALEYVFMLAKSQRYYYDLEAVKQASTGQVGAAANFARKTKESLIPQQSTIQHRADRQPTADSGTRNWRNTDLWFQSIKAPHGMVGVGDELVGIDCNPRGFKGAHFATFPPELIRPCIRAVTSEKGCCPACGAPWERVVSKRGGTIGKSWHDHSDDLGKGMSQYSGLSGGIGEAKNANGEKYTVSTIGWEPSCTCCPTGASVPYDPIPCVVLDPFGGSGTTGMVAKQEGRNYVLIELNQEYVDLARKTRLREDPQLKLHG